MSGVSECAFCFGFFFGLEFFGGVQFDVGVDRVVVAVDVDVGCDGAHCEVAVPVFGADDFYDAGFSGGVRGERFEGVGGAGDEAELALSADRPASAAVFVFRDVG